MKTVGVIGAGQMGAGIAQVSAAAGYRVLLSDVDLARAEGGKAGIAKQLARLVEKEKIDTAVRDATLGNIEAIGDVAAMSECDLVIEAATEREEIKRKIFEAVGKGMRGDAILASNTSSIPITRLAQASPDPSHPDIQPVRTTRPPRPCAWAEARLPKSPSSKIILLPTRKLGNSGGESLSGGSYGR